MWIIHTTLYQGYMDCWVDAITMMGMARCISMWSCINRMRTSLDLHPITGNLADASSELVLRNGVRPVWTLFQAS